MAATTPSSLSSSPNRTGGGSDRSASPTVGPGVCAGRTTNRIEEATTAGDRGLTYDPTTDRYTYVWQTKKAWRGEAKVLTVALADGTAHSAQFSFAR